MPVSRTKLPPFFVNIRNLVLQKEEKNAGPAKNNEYEIFSKEALCLSEQNYRFLVSM